MTEFDFVVDAKLVWARTPSKLKYADTVVVHHSSSDGSTIQSIHKQHLNRGHAGVDYNYVIEPSGVIYIGRGLLKEGGHVGNKESDYLNSHSVGICLVGAIHKHVPTTAQVTSAKRLIKAIVDLNGQTISGVKFDIKQIIGHRNVPYYSGGKLVVGKLYPTACPGQYMPMDAYKAILTGEEIEIPVYTRRNLSKGMKGEDVVEAQTLLTKLNYGSIVGKIDGDFGTKTETAVNKLLKDNNLPATGIVDETTWLILDGKYSPDEPIEDGGDDVDEPELDDIDDSGYPFFGKYIGSSFTNVRKGTSILHAIIGKFKSKEECVILSAKDVLGSTWYEVVLYNSDPIIRGWASAKYIEVEI